MASSRQVLLLAAVACLTSLASGTLWIVGDDDGWSPKFNATGWTDGKTFVVGDTLLFNYPKRLHTVAPVGEEDFATCNLDGNQLGAWRSGHDLVQLDRLGRWRFICTEHNHCREGMKLAIDVTIDDDDFAPSPAPVITDPFPGNPPPPPPSDLPYPGTTPPPPPPPPRSAAVRNLAGGAVAAAAAAVVTAALAF